MIFTLPIEPKAKARPRVTSNGTYMPRDYQEWRERFVALVGDQWRGEPFGMFGIDLTVTTKTGRMRPDLDNVLGAVLDALQAARVVENDRMCRWAFCEIVKGKTPGLTITIEAT